MAKLADLRRNQSVVTGAGLTFNPLLTEPDPVTGVDTAVAPDIIIPVPKAGATSTAVTTAMAVGNQTVAHNNAGAILHDILSLRMSTIQRVIAALTGQFNARFRFFRIADAVNATAGALYVDNADNTRAYRVLVTKVSGDTVTTLITERVFQNPPATAETTAATGTLNRSEGTGDATIAWLAPGLGLEKYADVLNSFSVAAAGTAISPNLGVRGNFVPPVPGPLVLPLAIPDIVIPVPKVVPAAATQQSFVPTALGAGSITIDHNDAGATLHDILSLSLASMARVIAALLGVLNDRRRYFVIANATNASRGAVYGDALDTTRQYRVIQAKVSGDANTLLQTERVFNSGGADSVIATGTLNLLSGTGDATIAWLTPGIMFEKYADVRRSVNVPTGAGGLTFDPGLVENGVRVMPDIVIPIPKAVSTVPFVPTDLTGAPGTVNVVHNNGLDQLHDVLSLRLYSAFRLLA